MSTAHRRLVTVAAIMAVALLGLTGCQETTPADQAEVINLVNTSRKQYGKKSLKVDEQLNVKADAWAQHLRDKCSLSHSNLSDGAPSDWRRLGENVGYAGSISQVHAAYMKSSGHRANILDGDFDRIGVGAVNGRCGGYNVVFTVQVFLDQD
ncbi:MAG: CAP domain-containing protein [Microthrixaceae bacterium]